MSTAIFLHKTIYSQKILMLPSPTVGDFIGPTKIGSQSLSFQVPSDAGLPFQPPKPDAKFLLVKRYEKLPIHPFPIHPETPEEAVSPLAWYSSEAMVP